MRDDEPETNLDMELEMADDGDDGVASFLLNQLGGGKSYMRERKSAYKKIVSEIFSPPRVTGYLARCPHQHLAPGVALDLTTTDPTDGKPWNFDSSVMRQRARALIEEQRPMFLIGSPVCTAWCSWQALNMVKHGNEGIIRRERTRSMVHINFLIELYRAQLDGGRYFVHEHPGNATSWGIPGIQKLLRDPKVDKVRGDQCQYGASVQFGDKAGSPVMKPSGFMSNSQEVLKQLDRRCRGTGGACSRPEGGIHVHCEGKVASDAARYPVGLVRSILKGFTNQFKVDGLLVDGLHGLQPAFEEDQPLLLATPEVSKGDSGRHPSGMFSSGRFKDDLTKQPLVDSLVTEARRQELAYFALKKVWLKVPRAECYAKTGHPPITVRWVDVNKGDDQVPKYRSRLVARQIKALEGANLSAYFAPSPPLEALRTVLSLARTT
jgi:hypothetical protein